MLSIGAETLPFELLLMDIGTLVVGYVLFKANKKISLNYTASQVLGTAIIISSFLVRNTEYAGFAGAVFAAGFLAKLGVFPFMWMRSTLSKTKAILGLVLCSQIAIVLLTSAISKEMMDRNALMFFGLLAAVFSSIRAIYDKKTKSSMSSIIVAQTASVFVSLSMLSPLSMLITLVSDLLAKFTILFSEERKDDVAQILAALYLAELPPFPTFSEQLEVLQVSLNIGIVINIIGLLLMVALLMHRVKGGKSLGARMAGVVLVVLGLVSLMSRI